MMTLIAAALAAAAPAPSADAHVQHQQQADHSAHQQMMDCCKNMKGDLPDCCKDMDAMHGGHEQPDHSSHH